ncbi:Pycsar system effector family protein [Paraburkholderia sp. EG287A]|uniref:Pycsar system effector family protein n=1 Tax=unclassified Paraburkholderia TaxID=2615204 RepID=UPI0034D26B23
MAKNDQEEQFEKLMSSNLGRVLDFIKFAETKNAALLTFCSAWLLGIASLLSSGKKVPEFVNSGLRLSFIFFAIGALFAIASFVPKLSIKAILKSPPATSNMLFFGDIAKMTFEAFSKNSAARYFPEIDHSTTDGYITDLSAQIFINSRIASRKMRLFNWGARCIFVALVMLVAPAAGQIL